MLLKEIKTVGDEKEFRILESIIDSESGSLTKEAIEALTEIKSRLSLPIVNEEIEPTEDSIFNVNFELEIAKKAKKNIDNKETGSTLFDQLCSMSNSLYNKKNG